MGQPPSSRVSPMLPASSATGASSRCSSTTASSHALMAPLPSPMGGSGALPPSLLLPHGAAPSPLLPGAFGAPFARRSATQNGGTLLDSIGLPGEEHGALFDALVLDDADAMSAEAAATAAAASLAVKAAGAIASQAQQHFVPRPPAAPPPPMQRLSVSGGPNGSGGGGGEPSVSPMSSHPRIQRRPTYTFGDMDGEGNRTDATPPTTPGGQAAVASGIISPAAGGFGMAGAGGFVAASPRFARASTTIGISSAPLVTLSRGALLPAEPPGDPAAFGTGMAAATAACASGCASGAATPTRGSHVDSPVNAGRKLLPPLQRAALHAQNASPRVSLTGASSPAAAATAAANGPGSANMLGLRAVSSSLTSPGSFNDLTCRVHVGDEPIGFTTPPGPSPAGGAGGTALVSSFALLAGTQPSGGRAPVTAAGRNSSHGSHSSHCSSGSSGSGRSSNDNIDTTGDAAAAIGLAVTSRAGTLSGPLPSLDASATAAALAALAAHPVSSNSLLSQARAGDAPLSAANQRPPLPHRRALHELPALEAS
ncbi:hypothetical protein HXX76_003314 [Chlamydomonas incerta]|uniref:Uncharacterized protein n=1 Tax=Chlamydomonas incerta TaxID=51695 RepID=A0A835TAP2_CHLIN|nr:hypothetical protein HXX76_003314 [Chlamydomonas incerta]|eukprot:KAG2441698.1 hypothetical protein HXX76_003314 [Chlamydomonas incerta]